MAISPMMKHYITTKENHKDSVLFYRLGDFYEMFFDDAILCSKELDLTLTGKDCGLPERAPMCGIPYHAAENYIAKLIEKGYRVAVCEQLTAPNGKGLVERDVIRIITPGTLVESSILDESKNNYIACISVQKKATGIAWADVSTGHLAMTEFSESNSKKGIDDTLSRITPAEVICNNAAVQLQPFLASIASGASPKFFQTNEQSYDLAKATELCKKQFKVSSLSVFDVAGKNAGISAVGALLDYLNETQKKSMINLSKIVTVKDDFHMNIDTNTRRNLEITESMSTRTKKGSILWVLDKTKTSIGARTLKAFVNEPLFNEKAINERLDSVDELFNNTLLLANSTELLSKINDIERIAGRIAYGTVSPRECIALKTTLEIIPKLKSVLNDASSVGLKNCAELLVDVSTLTKLLDDSIKEDAPAMTKDGGYIKDSFSKELEILRNAKEMGRNWLAKYEQKEKEMTGIKNLKIGFNKVFGYYIEVTKTGLAQVPYNYQRKQTTTNGERYITEELKDMEEKILGSEEKALKLESELFAEIKTKLLDFIPAISSISTAIGTIDSFCSLATVARQNNYVKPTVSSKTNKILIQAGRHPVVEAMMKAGDFVPNDTNLDTGENRTMIITGPNMAGKSTYLRQVAVITLMAHIGSFVPADQAEISLTDQIFTRIGASDDLAFGQSTFMVEMTEVSNILHNATSKSLLILDEVGRGTSTYDGLSIAWSVMEHLSEKLKAKTLFATHYHELTTLEGKTEGVKNYRVMVKELANSVAFLHKIVRGSANRSFGIEVAAMAGIPNEVIERAKQILKVEETKTILPENNQTEQKANPKTNEIVRILKDINLNNITPLEALATLGNLIEKVKK